MSKIFEVFLQNESVLRRYISKFTSKAQEVEDFMQETFLNGFAAELRGEIYEPKAFLFRVARNLVFSDKRKQKRSPLESPDEPSDLDQILDKRQATVDDWLEGRRKLALLAMAVAQLTPQCRKAFLLRRIDGLQYQQITNRMNISVSAVEKHVANGLLKCNAYLRAQGYDPAEFGASVTSPRADTVVTLIRSSDEQK